MICLDIPMPQNCGDCPCAHIFEGYKCMAAKRSFDKYPLENRMDWCPIIKTLERLWDELGDVPVDDDGIIQESFLWWPKGSDREDIWHWFDEKYPGGVKKLMKLEETNE